jgi:hypothetical protein
VSVPSRSESGAKGPSKKGVSPARNAIGVVVLVAVVVVGWLEYSAKSGYNNAVTTLDARTQNETSELMAAKDVEALIGKSPDGPGEDVNLDGRTFTKKTYTWRGVLKSYPLTAYYTKQQDPRLHHFQTEGAKPAGPAAEGGVEPTAATTPAPTPAPAGPGTAAPAEPNSPTPVTRGPDPATKLLPKSAPIAAPKEAAAPAEPK